MKKTVVITIFLLGMAFLGTKAFIALFAYQTIEGLKQTIQKEYSLTYSWISSNYDGAIVFHDLVVTPYRLKRTFFVERAELQYDGYMGLLFGLPGLKEGSWYGLQSLVLDTVNMPFEGRDPEELLALEYGENVAAPFRVHACGGNSRVTHDDLGEMGLKGIEWSLEIKLDTQTDREKLGILINLDMNELGKSQLESSWSVGSIPLNFSEFQPDRLTLRSLSFTHVEGGYFRRLSNYCSGLTGLDREHFSAAAARQWRKALSETGIDAGSAIEMLYRKYLLRGGQVSIMLKPKEPFFTGDFESLQGQDLISRFGISASLNGESVSNLDLRLNGDYFMNLEGVNEPLLKVQESENRFESDYSKRPFYILNDEIDLYIGKQAQIKLEDGKQFRGELISINEQKLEIAQLLGGGKVSYFLRRDQIIQIEITP